MRLDDFNVSSIKTAINGSKTRKSLAEVEVRVCMLLRGAVSLHPWFTFVQQLVKLRNVIAMSLTINVAQNSNEVQTKMIKSKVLAHRDVSFYLSVNCTTKISIK